MDGERLMILRKEKGLTQKELAEKLSVSINTISLYERNKIEPPDKVKIQISRFFDVSMDYLMGLIKKKKGSDVYQSVIFYFESLPNAAQQELIQFITYLQEKYKLEIQQTYQMKRE